MKEIVVDNLFIIYHRLLRKEAAVTRKAEEFKECRRVKIWERITIPVQPESKQSIVPYEGEVLKRKVRQLHRSQLSSLRSVQSC